MQSQSLEYLWNISDTLKSSAKRHRNVYLSFQYGIMRSNYSPEHQLPSQEDFSHSHRRNTKKREKSSENISNEERFAYRNPLIAPTSFMSGRKTRNFDPSK